MEIDMQEYLAAGITDWDEAEQISKEFGGAPETYRACMSLACNRWDDHEYAAARLWFRRALRAAQASWGEESLEAAKCSIFVGRVMAILGQKRKETAALLRTAKPVLERELGVDDPYVVVCGKLEAQLSR